MPLRSHRPGPRWAILVLLILAGALLAACSSPQTTFSPQSDAAQRVHTVYILVTVMASVVGVVVLGMLVYILYRFRSRPGREPSRTHGNIPLEIAWTVAPALVLVIIGVPTIFAIVNAAAAPDPDALEVRVVAHQWWWEVEYPGLGPDDANNPGEKLPLVTANEIHVPLGRQVAITAESVDVIHSLWIPQLAEKIDIIPGRVATATPFTPNQVGVYYAQCAEFCGSAHALMRFRVVVESLADFERWAQALQTPPAPSAGLAAQGQTLFLAKGCITCHTISGVPGAVGAVGPNLTRLGSRLTIAAGVMDNTDENLRAWIFDPRDIKPIRSTERDALSMPAFGKLAADDPRRMTEGEIAALAAYLRSMRVEER